MAGKRSQFVTRYVTLCQNVRIPIVNTQFSYHYEEHISTLKSQYTGVRK